LRWVRSRSLRKTGVDAGERHRFLQPDQRVPLGGIIGELSAQETKGNTRPAGKARAIYDYVIATMRYDKLWKRVGQRDAIWACTAKRGNCTDFHSCSSACDGRREFRRASRLDFRCRRISVQERLLDITAGRSSMSAPMVGFPVDASEAWKHPEKELLFRGARRQSPAV